MTQRLSDVDIIRDYEHVIARIYNKKTVVNFLCLNK